MKSWEDQNVDYEAKIFNDNIVEWRESHFGKYVLIKGDTFRFYTSLEAAFNAGIEAYGVDDFFVEQIRPKETVNVSFLGQEI